MYQRLVHRGNIAMMSFVTLLTCLADIAFNIVVRNNMTIVLSKYREIYLLHPFEAQSYCMRFFEILTIDLFAGLCLGAMKPGNRQLAVVA